jgi:hypothetical protein
MNGYQLVIPLCGATLCPYEMFKDIALTITGTTCLEEPLKSTVSSMMASDGSSGSGGSSDGGGYEDWKVVLVTAVVCLGVAALAAVAYRRYRSSDDAGTVRLVEIDSESLSDRIGARDDANAF